MQKIGAQTVKQWLSDEQEIAFLDVREHGQYGEGHPFLVVSTPYSRLELEVPRLVPRRNTRIVLLDADDGLSERAAFWLADMGYGNLHILEGGINGWKAAGFGLFKGVNLPSKTFGELVEHTCNTPRLQVWDLAAMQAGGQPVVVLDGRPRNEHFKMTIPGAICCPTGELSYRVHAMVPDETTPIVVHCAGRTRSIIGAQTLLNLGLPNPVFALENGTQGWYLADYQLDHGSERAYPDIDIGGDKLDHVRIRAEGLAERFGVPRADSAKLAEWRADRDRTTYVLDIRTPEELAADPYMGTIPAPAGQLLQSTDQFIGTRGARIIILDTDGIRAPVNASWLVQMGCEVYTLPAAEYSSVQQSENTSISVLAKISIDAAKKAIAEGSARLIDLRSGMDYRESHLAPAEWSIRSRLPEAVMAEERQLILIASDPLVASLASKDLDDYRGPGIFLLDGRPEDWAASGVEMVSTPDQPSDAECIDYLFFVHDRHDGNKEAARQYLAWETGLIEQLDASELALYQIDRN